MKRVTNLAASVRQRLLNEAKRRGESFDYIVSLYARERFLARLASSPHYSRLILKGAAVFALWLDAHRQTRDLDFLGVGNFDPAAAIVIVREIASVTLNDGLQFDASAITAEAIRERDQYHGARVHLPARLDSIEIRLQIDIGTGDVVTPAAQAAVLPVLLADFPPPRIKVYPPETIVAEKLHTMVTLGIANSRMKDFFDVYALASTHEFDEALLAKAIRRTFERRKTKIPEEVFALTEEFYSDRQKQAQWRAFVRKSGVNASEEFAAIGTRLRSFLLPLLESARNAAPATGNRRSQN